MTPPDEAVIRCPSCGGADVRKSHSKSLLDTIPQMFGFTALRCRSCRRRFYRRVWNPGQEEDGRTDGGTEER